MSVQGYVLEGLPLVDTALKARLTDSGKLNTFFTIWAGVINANLGKTNPEEKKSLIFTVSDEVFLDLVVNHKGFHGERQFVDPFKLAPVLQRLVLATQLVAGDLEKPLRTDWDRQELRTVGNRTIVLKQKDGKYFANEIPIVEVHESSDSIAFAMEKILWIRPEDIEVGIINLLEK